VKWQLETESNLNIGIEMEFIRSTRGIFAKILDFPCYFIIDFILKMWWTRSILRGPRATLVHGGPRTGPRQRLDGVVPCGHSGPWRLATTEGKGRADLRVSHQRPTWVEEAWVWPVGKEEWQWQR
jgi:hypothetical protein